MTREFIFKLLEKEGENPVLFLNPLEMNNLKN